MIRTSVAVAVLLISMTGIAAAKMPGSASHRSIGLGFHDVDAPVGIRWWLSGQKIGIDLGIGFNKTPATTDPDESLTGFAFDAGVPFVVHSWDRAHVLLRPGLLYESQEEGVGAGPTFDTFTPTTFSVLLEFEGELFLVDNISVSAAHGIAFSSFDPDLPGTDSETSFGTVGRNFTTVGFHMYFLGSEQ